METETPHKCPPHLSSCETISHILCHAHLAAPLLRTSTPSAASPTLAGTTPARLALHLPADPALQTVADVAHAWLARARGAHGPWVRSTRERYERVVRRHLNAAARPDERPLGAYGLTELTVDVVAAWSAANEQVLAPTTAVLALITLNQVCRYAVRRGWLADNPVARLEPGEKPRWTPQPVRALEGHELVQVLDQAGSYRALFEVLAYTGLRIGEALGLTWADVDGDRGVLRVHRQLSRYREHAPLKTPAAVREVILASPVVTLLRARWLTSPCKGGDAFVFATATGRSLDYRHVGDAFRSAVYKAGLRGPGRLSLHSLRHGYASLLIANGLNVAFVSRQLGHANPSVTMEVYAHVFAQREHGAMARQALDASYAAMYQVGQR